MADTSELLLARILVLLADQAHGLPKIWKDSWEARSPKIAAAILALPGLQAEAPEDAEIEAAATRVWEIAQHKGPTEPGTDHERIVRVLRSLTPTSQAEALRKCPDCGGDGYAQEMVSSLKCETCNGSGKVSCTTSQAEAPEDAEVAEIANRVALFEPYENRSIDHMVCNSIADDRATLLAKLRARTSQAEAPTREAYWTLLVGVMGLNTTTSNSDANMWRAADALVHLHRNTRTSQAEAQASTTAVFKNVKFGEVEYETTAASVQPPFNAYRECIRCFGFGTEVFMGDEVTCGHCMGKKRTPKSFDELVAVINSLTSASVGAPAPALLKCTACGGDGYEQEMVSSVKCHHCNGSGTEPAPAPTHAPTCNKWDETGMFLVPTRDCDCTAPAPTREQVDELATRVWHIANHQGPIEPGTDHERIVRVLNELIALRPSSAPTGDEMRSEITKLWEVSRMNAARVLQNGGHSYAEAERLSDESMRRTFPLTAPASAKGDTP